MFNNEQGERIIRKYDTKYTFLDFLKPTSTELKIFFTQTMLITPISLAMYETPKNLIIGLGSQVITYVGFRLYEALGNNTYFINKIKNNKVPSSKKLVKEDVIKNLDELTNY